MKKNQQIVLDLCLQDEESFENFYEGYNHELVNWLKRLVVTPSDVLMANKSSGLTSIDPSSSEFMPDVGQSCHQGGKPKGEGYRFLYLWGSVGSGRSHLLSACCKHFYAHDLKVAFLPLSDYVTLDPNILENLENYSLLCLDDINLIVQQKAWEEAIFHCYNKLSSSKTVLLVTANLPPQAMNFFLPDLKSRLSSCLVFQVQALTDEQKMIALKMRAQNRGLVLSDGVARYLLNHYRRSTVELFSFLEKLDQAALEKRQKITVPLIKKINLSKRN